MSNIGRRDKISSDKAMQWREGERERVRVSERAEKTKRKEGERQRSGARVGGILTLRQASNICNWIYFRLVEF
jgi:hypothetical protein